MFASTGIVVSYNRYRGTAKRGKYRTVGQADVFERGKDATTVRMKISNRRTMWSAIGWFSMSVSQT